MTTYRIKLTFAAPEIENFLGRNTLRMTVVASDAENLPNEIFLHQKTVVNAALDEAQDEFVSICSPYDLSDYPVNEPNPTQSPQFFRKSTIDILLPGIGYYSEVKEEIESQVTLLLHLLEQLEDLSVVDEVWIPDAPAADSSSSDSSSL